MPCNSDYMAPNKYEGQIMRTAALLVYIKDQLGLPISRDEQRFGMERDYCKITRTIGDGLVAELCNLMHTLTPEVVERLCYEVRSKDARNLADWWEEHQAADGAREAKENKGKLDRGYLFPKGSGVPGTKKDQMLEWYNQLGTTGQSYVNLLLLVRDNKAKQAATVGKD